jgi:ABC-type lipoprotein release transport system permease subunit
MAIRLALGATATRVVWGVVAETLRVVVIGALAGWVIALLIDRDVSDGASVDVALFTTTPLLLVGVATLAAWWPASRAGRMDPNAVLKQE